MSHTRDWEPTLRNNPVPTLRSKSKKLFSTFIITMNTNKSWYSLSKQQFNKYKHFFNTLLEPNTIKHHLLFQQHRRGSASPMLNNSTTRTRRIPQSHIVEFTSHLKTEVGEKLSRFHLHLTINLVLLKDELWSLPKFNGSLVRELYFEEFGEKLHLNIRAVRNQALTMKYYVNKSNEM